MRSARMLLATATATAALAIAAPTACADEMGDRDHDKHSYSKEHHKDGQHHAPRGGVHTGGGALAAVNEDDWDSGSDSRHDPDTYKDSERGHDSWNDEHGKDHYGDEHGKEHYGDEHGKEHYGDEHGKHEKDSWQGKHDKPRGGMHTGGGGLAAPDVSAGGLAALAVAGTGLYAVRRRKAVQGAA